MLSLEMFRRSDHPVRSIKGGFAIIFNVAATPPLRGGELCLSQFIHTLYDRAFLILRNARSMSAPTVDHYIVNRAAISSIPYHRFWMRKFSSKVC